MGVFRTFGPETVFKTSRANYLNGLQLQDVRQLFRQRWFGRSYRLNQESVIHSREKNVVYLELNNWCMIRAQISSQMYR